MSLEDEIEKDLLIDKTDLAHESATNPVKHYKYLRLLKAKKNELKIIENRLKQKRRNRFLYYIGKHPDEVCDTVYEKSEIKTVMEGDKELLKIEAEIHVMKNQVDLLEEVLRIFVNRGFAIRNMIDVKKMELGIN